MKSFSLKTLALAFVVVAGSAQGMDTGNNADQAQAYWGEATLNKVCDNLDKVFAKVSDPYADKTFDLCLKINNAGYEKTGDNLLYAFNLPYRFYRVSRTVFALGVVAAAYKTYKHFTKPAADATVEGENVEATETTVEVA